MMARCECFASNTRAIAVVDCKRLVRRQTGAASLSEKLSKAELLDGAWRRPACGSRCRHGRRTRPAGATKGTVRQAFDELAGDGQSQGGNRGWVMPLGTSAATRLGGSSLAAPGRIIQHVRRALRGKNGSARRPATHKLRYRCLNSSESRSTIQRCLAIFTSDFRGVFSGKVESRYWVGSASFCGHSIKSHSSGWARYAGHRDAQDAPGPPRNENAGLLDFPGAQRCLSRLCAARRGPIP